MAFPLSFDALETILTNFQRKFRELIVYLAHLSEGDDNFGSTKLNKLLFYIDFVAYRNFGTAVTDQRYQKLPNGPAPRALVPTIRQMIDDRDVVQQQTKRYAYHQHKTLALRDPDLSLFKPEEIDLINRVVNRFRDFNASQISEHSHGFIGWELAEAGEDIPYNVALVGRRDPVLPPLELEFAVGWVSLT